MAQPEQMISKKSSDLEARVRVDGLNTRAQALIGVDHARALKCIDEARNLALKIDFQIGVATSLSNLGKLQAADQQFDLAVSQLNKAKNIFERQSHIEGVLDCLLFLGQLHRDNEKLEQAAQFFDKGISFSKNFNKSFEADFLNNRAIISSLMGHYLDALEKYKIVIAIRKEILDLRGQAMAFINIGADLTNLGNYPEGLDNLLQAYEIIENNLDDLVLKVKCLVNIGNVYHDMNNNQLSINYYKLALNLTKKLKDKYMEITCLNNLGESYYSLENYKASLKTFETALKKSVKCKNKDLESYILDGLGKTQNQLGNFIKSIEYQEKSLEIAEESGDQQSKINALMGLADGYYGLEKIETAIDFYLLSLKLSGEIKQPKTAYENHQKLANAYQKIGNLAKTIEHLHEYHRLEREVLNQETAQKTRNLSIQFDLERARHEAEVYRVQNETMERANDLLEEKVRERTLELEEARVEIVMRLAMAAEYRDDSTGQHTLRVGRNSALLATALGLPNEQVELIRSAARLHDVGKIGITDLIMLKPGKLTFEEFERMKTHTTIGATMLSNGQSLLLKMAETIAWTHHERFDGTGYPRGLAGEDIPLVGRIVAVADVYDALRCERPYKRAWSVAEARFEIETQAGQHFDGQVVDVFLKLLDSGVDLG